MLSALTLYEFYGMTAKMGLRPFRWMGISIGVLMTAVPYYLLILSGRSGSRTKHSRRPARVDFNHFLRTVPRRA